VKPIPDRHHVAVKRKNRRRLDRASTAASLDPVLTVTNIQYKVAANTQRLSGIFPL
jgi:hypothetical protein